MHLDRRPSRSIVAVLLGLAPAWPLAADTILSSVKATSTVMTVQAMAKMESQALEQVHRQAKQGLKPARPAPKLLAIHGVLPALQAQLLIDGVPVLFEQGQVKPVDTLARGLRLRSIKPPCVSFYDRGQSHRLCLSEVGQ